MADDAEHRGDSIREEGSGRDTGKEDIIYTKLKNGSLKLYELEKELPATRCDPGTEGIYRKGDRDNT